MVFYFDMVGLTEIDPFALSYCTYSMLKYAKSFPNGILIICINDKRYACIQ